MTPSTCSTCGLYVCVAEWQYTHKVWETVENILEGHAMEEKIKAARNAAKVYGDPSTP